MDLREQFRQSQKESIAKRQEELAKSQQEYEKYLESEQHEREQWEHREDLWEAKAKKEGWSYTRKPFVSALERKQAEERSKQEEIAYLEEKLKQLKES